MTTTPVLPRYRISIDHLHGTAGFVPSPSGDFVTYKDALAAIAAAQAAQIKDAERWMKWEGEYEKQSYDVWVKGHDVVLGCWPNAGYMTATDGSGRQWKPGEVLAVRISRHQGRFPKPKFDAAIAASQGAA